MKLTPDGWRYVWMGESRRTVLPFHLRWFMPALLGTDLLLWQKVSRGCLLLLPLAVAWLAGFGWHGVAAGAMMFGLSGVMYAWWAPVTVDAPAILVSVVLAAILNQASHPVVVAGVVLLCLVGAGVKETVPVWAAVFAWSWIPLVGLCAVLTRYLMKSGPEPDGMPKHASEPLERPVQTALARLRTLQWRWLVLPWGGCLAALTVWDIQIIVALIISYGLLLVTTDVVRVYQTAAPIMAVTAAALMPLSLLPLFVLLHLCNPFKTEGV